MGLFIISDIDPPTDGYNAPIGSEARDITFGKSWVKTGYQDTDWVFAGQTPQWTLLQYMKPREGFTTVNTNAFSLWTGTGISANYDGINGYVEFNMGSQNYKTGGITEFQDRNVTAVLTELTLGNGDANDAELYGEIDFLASDNNNRVVLDFTNNRGVHSGSTTWRLGEVVRGVYTELDTSNATLLNNAPFKALLYFDGTDVHVLIDGVEIMSATTTFNDGLSIVKCTNATANDLIYRIHKFATFVANQNILTL